MMVMTLAEPAILFQQPVELLARQHYIFSEDGQRNFVDLAFFDDAANEVVLVELKRGKIAREHYAQLRRYLDGAEQSKMLRTLLKRGAGLRGIVASTEEAAHESNDDDITAAVVDRKAAIEVLLRLRRERLSVLGETPEP